MEPLRREVLAPTRIDPRGAIGWLGAVGVLGTTLALAMATATMALAPRSHRHRCGRALHRAAVAPPVMPTPAPPIDRRCGAPVLRARGDGMVDVTYEVCARPVTPAR